mmetsp:Transcript_46334/g.134972  ORF Transcript_46334/g.134972 Transcript_46334/m.134972 type:complete len:486 (+) Transcript_46334:98-1555(+)
MTPAPVFRILVLVGTALCCIAHRLQVDGESYGEAHPGRRVSSAVSPPQASLPPAPRAARGDLQRRIRAGRRRLCAALLAAAAGTTDSASAFQPSAATAGHALDGQRAEGIAFHGGVGGGWPLAVASKELAQEANQERSFPQFKNLEIVRLLGNGRFGTVWQGRLLPGNTDVAVKGFGYTDFAHVQREIGITEMFGGYPEYFLKVYRRVHEVGAEHSPFTYMVQELAVGNLERDVVAKPFEDVPLRARLELARQVLEGLAIMADHGIAHRDIKPDNILLSWDRHGQRFRAKIADFGLACVVDERAADYPPVFGHMKHDVYGNLAIMAPENFDRARSLKGDVYSMSIVLYRLIFGQSPPRLQQATQLFEAGQVHEIDHIVRECRGFRLKEDAYFVTAMEASELVGLEGVRRLFGLMLKMQATKKINRITAKEAADELRLLHAIGGKEDWEAAEQVVLASKTYSVEACRGGSVRDLSPIRRLIQRRRW